MWQTLLAFVVTGLEDDILTTNYAAAATTSTVSTITIMAITTTTTTAAMTAYMPTTILPAPVFPDTVGLFSRTTSSTPAWKPWKPPISTTLTTSIPSTTTSTILATTDASIILGHDGLPVGRRPKGVRLDSGPPCSDIHGYRAWLLAWAESCQLPGKASVPSDFFASCSWITCNCAWGVAGSPVAAREHRQCFVQNLMLNKLSLQMQWFVAAIGKICKAHIDALVRPCGQCDRHCSHRECGGLEDISGASFSGARAGVGLDRGAYSMLSEAAKCHRSGNCSKPVPFKSIGCRSALPTLMLVLFSAALPCLRFSAEP